MTAAPTAPLRFQSWPLSRFLDHLAADLSTDPASPPRCLLILGAGFSAGPLPTARQALRHDIAAWLFARQSGQSAAADSISTGPLDDRFRAFALDLWKQTAADTHGSFRLDPDGFPALFPPDNVVAAFLAIFSNEASRGLNTPALRRAYLADLLRRGFNRTTPAHLYLASLLSAQQNPALWTTRAPFARTILTSALDPLLQFALQTAGVPYNLLDRPLDILSDETASTAVWIAHVHGTGHNHLLISGQPPAAAQRDTEARSLVDALQSHTVIVLGYGGWPDPVMAALRQCDAFPRGLFWCGHHPPELAASALRREVRLLLENGSADAVYVPIPSADLFMRDLHARLGLGPAPIALTDPLSPLAARLAALELPDSPLGPGSDIATPLPAIMPPGGDTLRSLHNLLTQRLDTLRRALLPDPVDELSLRQLTRLNRAAHALLAGASGDFAAAIPQYTRIITDPQATPVDRATALLARGLIHGRAGHPDPQLADYSTVIALPGASSAQKAWALIHRGLSHLLRGQANAATADCTAVLELPDAPPDLVARARINRAVLLAFQNRLDEALADCAAVRADESLPPAIRVEALFNQGLLHSLAGNVDQTLADCTAVLDSPDAPDLIKASALVTRGEAHAAQGHAEEAIADYAAALASSCANPELKARALLNRALEHVRTARPDAALADYAALAAADDAPRPIRAKALANAGWLHYEANRLPDALAAARAALDLDPDSFINHFNLNLYLLVSGEHKQAKEHYLEAIGSVDSPAALTGAIADLEQAIQRYPQYADPLARVLDRLRARLAQLPQPDAKSD